MKEEYLKYYTVEHVDYSPLAQAILDDLRTCTYFIGNSFYSPVSVDIMSRAKFIAYRVGLGDDIDAEFYIPMIDKWTVIQRYYEEESDSNPTRDFYKYLAKPQFLRTSQRLKHCLFCTPHPTPPTLLHLASTRLQNTDHTGVIPEECQNAIDDMTYNRRVCHRCWIQSFGPQLTSSDIDRAWA